MYVDLYIVFKQLIRVLSDYVSVFYLIIISVYYNRNKYAVNYYFVYKWIVYGDLVVRYIIQQFYFLNLNLFIKLNY